MFAKEPSKLEDMSSGTRVAILVLVLASTSLLGGCSSDEAPLVEMRSVPTVVGMNPAEAREALEDAGFKVEFTRPTAYCIPKDSLCNGPLDDEALTKLDVATQSGTQGKKRPEGSTITLILGSPIQGTTVE